MIEARIVAGNPAVHLLPGSARFADTRRPSATLADNTMREMPFDRALLAITKRGVERGRLSTDASMRGGFGSFMARAEQLAVAFTGGMMGGRTVRRELVLEH